MVPPARPASYYGRPILKEPIWRGWIPAYFFAGGVAAGSSLLAFGGRLTGQRRLARRARVTALVGITASAACLVTDLGRPERFANMLRVARPTSPMSMGSWLLAVYGPAAGIAAATDVAGILPGVGAAAEAAAAALAPAVATYTGVLLADTSVPAWHGARQELPLLFASGAAASAGGVALALGSASAAARRMAMAGGAGELAVARVMEQRLGPIAEPYRTGRAGRMRRVGTALTSAGIGLVAASRRGRPAWGRLGGVLLAAGAALERFTVVEAGRQSTRDPKYVVGPQRARSAEQGYRSGHVSGEVGPD